MTLAVATFLTLSTTAHSEGGVPRSALPGVKSVETVQRMVMPEVDAAELLAEDLMRESSGVAAPVRFATAIHVTFAPESAGTWETLDDGSRLWRLRIASPGALSMNLGLEKFDLPVGASFWVHDPEGAQVQGPYTAANRNATGGLWTAIVLGNEVVAELHLPAGSEADIEIASVNHGYRFFSKGDSAPESKRGACNINVICPQGDPWRNQIRSVARITIGGIFLCTGHLINNTAEDNTPYFLTAQHCIEVENEAPTVVAYWNYETSACDDFSGGSLSQNQSGSTWIASSPLVGGTDFTLVELDQSPSPTLNVYFTGWDARDRTPSSTTAIHHPGGDEKSISLDYDPPTATDYLSNTPSASGTHWRIADWDEATTEGGSSGGCLFDDATGLCVGTLSGGYAACGNGESDWYGRLSLQWAGEGTSGTRLSDWLDPLDTGALFLGGKNAGGSAGEETWLIPAAASLPGEAPSNWKSQLAVANPTAEERAASIYFVAKGQAWPGKLLSGPHTIAPNASLYINDPLLPANPTSGLMYVTVDGPGTAVFVRTYNLVPDGTTFGQGQPGIPLGYAKSSNELVLPLVHSAPGVFRTNVGFAQTSAGIIQVKAEIFSAAGVRLAQKTYSQSAAWHQINDIFANMGIGSQMVEGGWIRVTLVNGSPAFWTTYATVIDANTDDPTYIFPVAP